MDVKAILEEQKALQLLMSEFAKAEGDERSALEEAIAAQAAKIEAMGEVLSDEVSASYPDADESEAVIEVELSAAQRQRVFEQTGVDVPTVVLPDPDGMMTANMAHLEPSFFEEKGVEAAEALLQMQADAEELEAAKKALEEELKGDGGD